MASSKVRIARHVEDLSLFAQWSMPLIVSMLTSAERPARLILDADYRALTFGLAVTVAVRLLFGLAPALRAFARNLPRSSAQRPIEHRIAPLHEITGPGRHEHAR
jgi:hypothetical protein